MPFACNLAPLLVANSVRLLQPNRCIFWFQKDHADLRFRSPGPLERGEAHVLTYMDDPVVLNMFASLPKLMSLSEQGHSELHG
jgi:hypothetical protein